MCVHGNSHSFPTADQTVVLDEQPYFLMVGVVEKMLVTAILEWVSTVLFDTHKRLSSQVFTRARPK